MPAVYAVDQVILGVQHSDFHGGGSDIDSGMIYGSGIVFDGQISFLLFRLKRTQTVV